ncbi:efflux RND transporter permease subunit [Rhodohalobacter sp.]|uniref:efflux RND transporter permease subunit n=1 Tax=Rhodohalobacter sp. TaxID=1974210 RepID=UPI002ACE3B9A|nr:efflux RND transporter permease subunit [Rhodohalobacter sp.]MDZ7756278.1 efflux RND transporter permease subunit [Rhodohalobacter sp.]
MQFELRGYDIDKAYELAQQIKLRVEELPGIVEVRSGRSEGTPEERIIFDRNKIADLGLSVREVAQIIQTNIGGSRAGSYRIGGDEYPITVAPSPRRSPGHTRYRQYFYYHSSRGDPDFCCHQKRKWARTGRHRPHERSAC